MNWKKYLLSLLCLISISGATIPSASSSSLDGLYMLNQRASVLNNPVYLETPVDSNYEVGPGDFFELFMENQSLLVQVSPDGKIGLEFVGVFDVAGLKLPEAKKKILESLSKIYLGKECFVKLAQIRAPLVTVYGAIANAGQVQMRAGVRLSAMIRDMGGLLPRANADSILLIRSGDTTVQKLLQAETGADISADVLLKAGDIIIIPEYVLGADVIQVYMAGVGRTLPYHAGWTVAQYLRQSRLLRVNQFADTHVEIQNTTTMVSRLLPMAQALSEVPESGSVLALYSISAQVYVGGAVQKGGAFDYLPNKNPLTYMTEAGLQTISDLSQQVEVTRKDGTVEKIDVRNGIIFPGDYINVSKSNYETTKDVSLFSLSLIQTLVIAISTVVTIWSTIELTHYNTSK